LCLIPNFTLHQLFFREGYFFAASRFYYETLYMEHQFRKVNQLRSTRMLPLAVTTARYRETCLAAHPEFEAGMIAQVYNLFMPLNSSDLQTFMTTHGIAGEILHLSVPTPTVETAARALGVQPEQIVKSILFLVGAGLRPALTADSVGAGSEAWLGGVCPPPRSTALPGASTGANPVSALTIPVLAITCGTAYVERRAIAAHYGVGRKRVKLASPEEVRSISGYEVGAMPPFGHRQPLPTLLDCRVLDLPVVYAGGGDENAMLRLDPQEIVRISGAAVMDLCALPGKD
jgi:prolyl-tRNA editing enzyme YbaK/EbsC (Cys-tRNA(Pro) deacylase)